MENTTVTLNIIPMGTLLLIGPDLSTTFNQLSGFQAYTPTTA